MKMKNTASVGTLGHFDMAGLEGQENIKIDDITFRFLVFCKWSFRKT